MSELIKYKRIIKSLLADRNNISYPNIVVHGRWNEWILEFIQERICAKFDVNGKIACFSVNTFPEIIRLDRSRYKVFQTGENTHVQDSHWQQFEYIHRKEKSLSLSLGFDYLEEERYMRFPFWINAHFEPKTQFKDVKQFVNKYCYQKYKDRKEFCSFICKKDYFGDRAIIADEVGMISSLMYPSDFRHNDDRMRKEFKDNKIDYLNRFKFNLCPENSNNKGYVTEKVFDAIKSGCVPIYWGNEGFPETDILNKDAIIFLDKDNPDKSDEALKLIELLNANSNAYAEFASQPRFVKGAECVIYDYFERLEQRLKTVFEI